MAQELGIPGLDGILREVEMTFMPTTVRGIKKGATEEARVLTPVCSVGEEQRCGPPASVIRTAVLPLQGGHCSLKGLLAWVFSFSFLFFLVRRSKITGGPCS